MRLWYFLIILHARIQEISSGEGGVQAYPPQVYFSHSLNLQRSNGKFFIKKPIISKTPEGVQHFPGGGPTFRGGGGVIIAYSP